MDSACGHRHCKACVGDMVTVMLKTGEVDRIVCLEAGCGVPLPEQLIR